MKQSRNPEIQIDYSLSSLPPQLRLQRSSSFRGQVTLPGSKSIANRALLLSALAEGETLLDNLPDSEDIETLIAALPALGVATEPCDTSDYRRRRVRGVGGTFPVHSAQLQLENAGTALRPLTAILAFCAGDFLIDGNEQMRRRPIVDLTDGLRSLGVDVRESNGCPPVTLSSRGVDGGRCCISGRTSSQYISALLMAAPLARKSDLEIELSEDPVSKPYIDMTIAMMASFGVMVERDNYRYFRVPHNACYRSPGSYTIEGDASAASYFLAAGALPGSGPVEIFGLPKIGSLQGDAGFADLMVELGAEVEYLEQSIRVSNPSGELRGADLDMNAMPDAAMTLAVLALFCNDRVDIRNIANLRVKESERIRGLHSELVKLGAIVREEHDSLHITPPKALSEAVISTYNDHRMAMAFSLASFGTSLTIDDPACVRKTYPQFFVDFMPLCLPYGKP